MQRQRKSMLMSATAAAAVIVMGLSACGGSSSSSSSSGGSSDTFVLGGLFPETGSLAYLGPAETSAWTLAANDIDAAGGVLGNKISKVSADVSDADHADQNTAGAQSVLSKKPSVILGPASSSVVKNTYKVVAESKVPMISMGATSPSLSGISPYFFRTVPPDSVQGAVLGNLIAGDGVQNLAIAVFNDEYGTNLRSAVVKSAEAAGVNVVYGEKDSFDPTETNFSSLVTSIKATKPDAVLVIAFDQSKQLLKEMSSQGLDTKTKLYLCDGNTADYSKDFDAGFLEGAQGTIPGAHPSDAFQKRLKSVKSDLSDFTYSAETYDGVILSALAAQKGGAVDGETIQKNLAAVSGADGGTKCSSYKDCLALLKDKKDIQYVGQSGIGAFNSNNDPSSASIGIYKFDSSNKPVYSESQEGEVPKS
ncbi:ABC transporter substrate-binding protein [Bifidobacterium psychraerophilum]|jgi:branched-chain amino acid transport system substrate-binding protein|uniref:Branched-chain amino acid ABC transporter, substrate-binding protein n=1 Tax=Bifidobacterium psychraerophilum TaxID=218140 RepID=A0A087CI08_9BIFI|nr:ABC transporter substrate-binding protein [Bifidobacterium psychraerophilum]KFI82908.1 branched-chain amino acid ABC transporter, substrate-binding protein [Bifidobacterium psychraerophilum]MCI1661000.1 ABC transporter substrate-binding protein [Bifidobacterium psychraerophilum]MCI1803739.1 ABC transporter substrate-binding protein [Bifidobacterium psychraerophilum]MCI2176253.1 ABC transporter substrate-binding protein [Bifidobacterium psychraerophilum]MCI2181273.1 ABC transporter substrate